MAQKLPDKGKIKKTESSIEKIKSALTKLAGILKGTRQKLAATKDRPRTPEQKRKYAALVKVQAALEKGAKTQADKYKVLAATMGKFRNMATAVAKGAKAAAKKVLDTVKKPVTWLASKIKRKQKGLRDIEALDDLGVAPLVIWGLVVATIAALSAAIGLLLSNASKLEEQINALNDEIDSYENDGQPEEPEPEERLAQTHSWRQGRYEGILRGMAAGNGCMAAGTKVYHRNHGRADCQPVGATGQDTTGMKKVCHRAISFRG